MTSKLLSWMSRGQLRFGRAALGALALTLAVGSAASPAAAQTDDGGSYGYLRVVDGPANLIQAESGSRTEAEINQPLLAGDSLWVPAGSRLEAVLSDGNLLRVDGGTEIVLHRLAGSPDGDDPSTVLELREGNVQLVVFEEALGDELPRIDTPNATFYVQRPGTFRLTSDQGTWSAFLVRDGSAEVVTERGSVVVRADEEAVVEGERLPRTAVHAASGRDALERWAVRLDEEAERYASHGELGDLAYQGASLGQYGSWHTIGQRRLWRPNVEAGWRPYWQGRWAYTPAGLTWVSYEPWGWVPYHYGSWDFIPGWGWGWEAGRVWAPSWVYWYWGPRYASWCPVGYYTRHYGYPGYHDGIYGWAGGYGGGYGGYGGWDDWNFVDINHIGRRDQHAYSRKGRDIKDQLRDLQRGIITTDTRGVTPERWKNPGSVLRVLQERGEKGGQLPDVTPFVARQPKLPPGVLRTVQADRPADGTPFKPASLGRVGKLRNPGDTSWATPRGDGGKRPTIQIGGGSGSRGSVRGGGSDGSGGSDAWRERGNRGPRVATPGGATGGRPSGKTWDRPSSGESTGERGERGPRIRLPERDSGSSAPADSDRPSGKVRGNAPESGDRGERGPRIRVPESSGDSGEDRRPSGKTYDPPPPPPSPPAASEPSVRQPERGSDRDRGDGGDRNGRVRGNERPPAQSWRQQSSEPRVRSSEPSEPKAWQRPQMAPRPSQEPRYRPQARPEARSGGGSYAPSPRVQPARPAPQPAPRVQPSRPAPEPSRSASPSRGSDRGGDRGGRGGGGDGGRKSGNDGGGRSHGRIKPPQQ